MQAPRVLGRTAVQQLGRRHAHNIDTIQSTLNDLPQPSGNWKTRHDANNRKYTAHLLLGIGAFAGSILFGITTGLFEPHNDIPRVGPPQQYK